MARRPLNVFSLSFLDCMCCGFGAIILVYMILTARIEQESDRKLEDVASERIRLENRVLAGERELDELQAALARAFEEASVAEALHRQQLARLGAAEAALAQERMEQSEEQVRLEATRQRIYEEEQAGEIAEAVGERLRTVVGEGNRQYLTGLQMGGRRILILVDKSASMLASTLVNVIRLRYRPDEEKRVARKWKQVVDTVDWLTANFPSGGVFQIFTFDTEAQPVLRESAGAWIETSAGALDEVVRRLRETAPGGGTSLEAAFEALSSMNPRPDNVYLLVDGLPTQGSPPSKASSVSGRQRQKYFEEASHRLPRGVPVNVILLPMEGDPKAAESYWQLARATGGSFMSPSEDWP